MKSSLCTFLFLAWLMPALAQEVGTSFFNSKWQPCSKRQSTYERVIARSTNDSSFYVRDYLRSENILVMTGSYSSLDPEVEEGLFHFYHIGNLNYVGTYTAGEMTGTWKMMDKKNKLIKELHYDIDTTTPTFTHKKLDLDTTKPIVEVQPYFGNDSTHRAMMQFVRKNIIYPPLAWIRRQQGSVRVGFMVERNGSLSSFKVIDAPFKDLGREALRVFSTMPNWEPGKMNGHPVRVKMTIPVKFYLAE